MRFQNGADVMEKALGVFLVFCIFAGEQVPIELCQVRVQTSGKENLSSTSRLSPPGRRLEVELRFSFPEVCTKTLMLRASRTCARLLTRVMSFWQLDCLWEIEAATWSTGFG